jgi:hypothetical protein
MNLREFLEYRKDCPCCGNPLTTSFHSQRKQKIRYEDGRFIILFDLADIGHNRADYKVGYSIGLEDNSFQAEFYTYNQIRFDDETPLFLILKFQRLEKNLGTHKIYRHCITCDRYHYESNIIEIDYKKCSIGDLTVNVEFCFMILSIDEGFKVYKVLNLYSMGTTSINYGKVLINNIIYETDPKLIKLRDYLMPEFIQTGIIPFTTHDDTVNRVAKLITFS